MKNYIKVGSILYVEDEKEVQKELAEVLENFCETLYLADNGLEGLEQYKKYKPDIIITDIKMPIMDGIEMSKKIKEIDYKEHVIFITAFSDIGFFKEAIELQVDGYILKPIDLNILEKKLSIVVDTIQMKKELSKQYKLLNDVLNSTSDIMFITDFKDVKYSNTKFNNLIKIDNENLLNMFNQTKGYLHADLLDEGEDFASLVFRTIAENRIVSIHDKNDKQKYFTISVVKSTDNADYVVTLSDITKMKEYQIQTEKKAYIDGLTNVYNRNKFDEVLQEAIHYAKRYTTPFSIALIDVDKFKDVNDNYGHLIGDEVLISMAQTLNTSVRETDTFARWGGEEFVILFQNTNAQQAKIIAEKLRKMIQDKTHPTAGRITASFGITEYRGEDSAQSIFKRCDNALYMAKENGRNRVEIL